MRICLVCGEWGWGWGVEVGEEKDLEDRRLYTRRQDMELYKEE